MNQWTYDVTQFTVNDIVDCATAPVIEAFNVRGNQGWELVGFTATPTSTAASLLVTCVWKRRAEQTPAALLQ